MRNDSDYPDDSGQDEIKRPNTIHLAAGLLMMTMVLVTFGLTMLYSASSSDVSAAAAFFRNQLMWVGVGTFAGIAAFTGGYRFFCKRSWLWLAGCALLLVWARFSREINGAHRWIILGSFRFQPSELAKIAVALFVSWYCTEYLRTFNDIRRLRQGIWGLGAGVGGTVLLILWGDDMGTSVLVASMAFLTMFAGNLKWP
jgi:cell division protein FtsW